MDPWPVCWIPTFLNQTKWQATNDFNWLFIGSREKTICDLQGFNTGCTGNIQFNSHRLLFCKYSSSISDISALRDASGRPTIVWSLAWRIFHEPFLSSRLVGTLKIKNKFGTQKKNTLLILFFYWDFFKCIGRSAMLKINKPWPNRW